MLSLKRVLRANRGSQLRSLCSSEGHSQSHTTTLIGDVEVVVKHPKERKMDLVPSGYLEQLSPLSMETMSHFRWLAQKYTIGQDSMLLGHVGPLRRHIVLAFAEACKIEVEYLRLSRDTTGT